MHSLIIARLMLRRTIGTRKGIILLVIVPSVVLSIMIALFGFTKEQPHSIAVWNADKGMLGKELLQAFTDGAGSSTESYILDLASYQSEAALREAVKSGQTDAAVLVPANYTEDLMNGRSTQAKLFRKDVQQWNAGIEQRLTSEAEQMRTITSIAAASTQDPAEHQQMLARLLHERSLHHIGIELSASDKEKMRKPFNILVNGVTLLFVMLAINQSVQAVMEDRTNRTMARMFAAPVRSYEIALGNFLGSVLVGTIQLLIMLTITRGMFGYDYGMGFIPQFIVLECFLLAAVGLATAVGGMVTSVEQLSQVNNFIITPTCMLGGCFWPIRIVPDFMQKLANFMPQKWAMEAMSQLAFGNSFQDILLPIGILLLFAAVLLAFGVFILQPSRTTS